MRNNRYPSDGRFTNRTFNDWRTVAEKFKKHEKSGELSQAIIGIMLQKAFPINAVLSEAVQKDLVVKRAMLEVMFSLLRYLRRRRIAFGEMTTEVKTSGT